jgi:hypothetical protein
VPITNHVTDTSHDLQVVQKETDKKHNLKYMLLDGGVDQLHKIERTTVENLNDLVALAKKAQVPSKFRKKLHRYVIHSAFYQPFQLVYDSLCIQFSLLNLLCLGITRHCISRSSWHCKTLHIKATNLCVLEKEHIHFWYMGEVNTVIASGLVPDFMAVCWGVHSFWEHLSLKHVCILAPLACPASSAGSVRRVEAELSSHSIHQMFQETYLLYMYSEEGKGNTGDILIDTCRNIRSLAGKNGDVWMIRFGCWTDNAIRYMFEA